MQIYYQNMLMKILPHYMPMLHHGSKDEDFIQSNLDAGFQTYSNTRLVGGGGANNLPIRLNLDPSTFSSLLLRFGLFLVIFTAYTTPSSRWRALESPDNIIINFFFLKANFEHDIFVP